MVLHRGAIAEMKTGEGKTLVATAAGVPERARPARASTSSPSTTTWPAATPSGWGASTSSSACPSASIVHGLRRSARRQHNYRCDITYGTNTEFGFDYLRDNMKDSIERYVQRELHYAIVDEVDSILIDEARTPLIISGPAEAVGRPVLPGQRRSSRRLRKDIDYTVDEKAHSAILTDEGVERVEKQLDVGNLYDPANIEWLHHVTQALGRTRSTSATSTT